MSTGIKFGHAVALKAAQSLVTQLHDVCEQIEIAGSLRRGKPMVGDIELAVLPKVIEREAAPVARQMSMFEDVTLTDCSQGPIRESLLDSRLDELVGTGYIRKVRPFTSDKGGWGPKMKQFWVAVNETSGVAYITVDLFIVTPPAQWGPIFTIRTGPATFSGAGGLMKYINERTGYQQTEGRLIVRDTGEEVQTPTERSYFDALGLPWIKPEVRTQERLWQVVRSGNVTSVKNAPGAHLVGSEDE